MATHNFKKLKVWQKAIDFITFIYEVTSKFPKEEKYGLVDQIRRASVSIALNIAEGAGSGTNAEFKRFLKFSQRSAYEVLAALEISTNLNMTNNKILTDATVKADELSAMLSGLIKSLKSDV